MRKRIFMQQKICFFMCDLSSNQRVRDGSRFAEKYTKDIVIEISGNQLAKTVVEEWNQWNQDWNADHWFPHDIYCFDASMDWYVIFTHEGWDQLSRLELGEDDYIRICLMKRAEN